MCIISPPFNHSAIAEVEHLDNSPFRYFLGELYGGNALRSTIAVGNEKKRQRVYNTMFHVPWRCERVCICTSNGDIWILDYLCCSSWFICFATHCWKMIRYARVIGNLAYFWNQQLTTYFCLNDYEWIPVLVRVLIGKGGYWFWVVVEWTNNETVWLNLAINFIMCHTWTNGNYMWSIERKMFSRIIRFETIMQHLVLKEVRYVLLQTYS